MRKLWDLLRFLRWRLHVKVPFNNFSKKVRGADNSIQIASDAIWSSRIVVIGRNNSIHIENSRFIKNVEIKIFGDGNTVFIGHSTWIKNSQLLIEGNSNYCAIGAESTIEGADIFLTEDNTRLEVGEDCMFADSVVIRTGDSHSIYDLSTRKRLNKASNIEIGCHVWLAQGVTILKKSIIPDGSIVAARSLVNKKFHEGNIVIAGVPAKQVKRGIFWERAR